MRRGENSQAKRNGDKRCQKMNGAQVPKAGADFEITEREIPQSGSWLSKDSRAGLIVADPPIGRCHKN
jgi:hypothetical protein